LPLRTDASSDGVVAVELLWLEGCLLLVLVELRQAKYQQVQQEQQQQQQQQQQEEEPRVSGRRFMLV